MNVSICRLNTQYVGVAAFTILIWDHIVSFSDEVEYVWKGNKGPSVYLFFLNRYITPLGFIVNLYAYFATTWTHESCARFVRYEGSMTMIGISVVALMMFLRIRALYNRQIYVQGAVIIILLTYIGVNAWLLTHGISVHHSSLVESCTMIFDPKIGPIAAASAWLPLLYDTVVLLLTLHRTLQSVWRRDAGQIIRVLLKEGILYFAVIFSVTLVLTVMIVAADPTVKNITAQLELLLTVTMMSRITIHLKRFARMNALGYSISVPTPRPQPALAWNTITHPSRVRHMLPPSRRGHIQHVHRVVDDSFFSMVTQPGEGVSTQAQTSRVSNVSRALGRSHTSGGEIISIGRDGAVGLDVEEELYGAGRVGARSVGGGEIEHIEMTMQKAKKASDV